MKLEKPIKLSKKLCNTPNLCDQFGEEDLRSIGLEVKEGFELDLESRSLWQKRYQMAMDLALQVMKAKTFPWPDAANVKFPLITIAAMQWHSRAYPTLISGTDVVKCRVNGPDPQGQKSARAQRISKFMSWQVMEEDAAWEEETDRAFIQLPIVGSVFKKTRHDSVQDINVSEMVPASDFVLNYYAKSVETCSRKTHILYKHRNEIVENMRLGAYYNYESEDWLGQPPQPDPKDEPARKDKRTGLTAPSRTDMQTPFQLLEQHVLMDLDDDGYAEPYIITCERVSGCVLRIVCGFDWSDVKRINEQIVRIKAHQYFTKYEFMPSPDGGIYGMGFGALLGPLNASVDSIINQLIDAGTLATTSGGFLGRGVKMRGGEYSFRPFGWQRVDSTGDDLSKGIVPFPVREPSNVLFQLLGLLIDYTNRISGSTDIMVGENPGQNTPAQTSQLMSEQGAKINSAIFKRVWRGMKQEFCKLYKLNKIYITEKREFGEKGGWVNPDDFTGPEEDIRPAADPNLTSDTMRMQQAQMVAQRAQVVPGYDKELAERNLLKAMKIEDIEQIFPGQQKFPAPTPLKIAIEQIKAESDKDKVRQRMAEKYMDLSVQREKNQSDMELTKAQIAEILAGIGGAQAAQQLQAFELMLKAGEREDAHLAQMMEMFKDLGNGQPGKPDGQGSSPGGRGIPAMGQQPGNAGGVPGSPQAGGAGM